MLKPGGTLVVAVQGAAHLAAFWALFNPVKGEAADAATQRQLAPWPFGRLDRVVPAVLEPQTVHDLAVSYGSPAPVSAEGAVLLDSLHLAVFRISC